jgi:hypothetical protein
MERGTSDCLATTERIGVGRRGEACWRVGVLAFLKYAIGPLADTFRQGGGRLAEGGRCEVWTGRSPMEVS